LHNTAEHIYDELNYSLTNYGSGQSGLRQSLNRVYLTIALLALKPLANNVKFKHRCSIWSHYTATCWKLYLVSVTEKATLT